jgi:hypothetical protein
MNSRHEIPPRWPAGPIPAPIRTLRTLVGEIWIPSPMSSPVIRRYPHRGFSRASRRISSRTSRPSLGRPGRRPGYVQRRATSPRCHASSVPGVTKNACQRSLGSSLLAAARNARSAGRSAGRDTCRRSTAISWRRTTISSSLCSDERKHINTSAIKRPNSTYSNDASTGPSLIDGASDTTASSAQNARASGHDRVYAPHSPPRPQPPGRQRHRVRPTSR